MTILSRAAVVAFVAISAVSLATPSFASYGAPIRTGAPIQSGIATVAQPAPATIVIAQGGR